MLILYILESSKIKNYISDYMQENVSFKRGMCGKKTPFLRITVCYHLASLLMPDNAEGMDFSFQIYPTYLHYHISSVIKQRFFTFQNTPKSLDLSYKTDLDLWDC